MADAAAIMFSVSGASLEVGGFIKGMAEGAATTGSPPIILGAGFAEAAVANGAYQAVSDEVGDRFGYLGLFYSALSDYYGSNTYFSHNETQGDVLIVGQGTQVATVLTFAGAKCPFGVCDALFDTLAIYNDSISLLNSSNVSTGPFRSLNDMILPLQIDLPDSIIDFIYFER